MGSSKSLSEANTTFSLALLRKLSEDNKTANIFFSPFSISSALAMAMLGARGNTATQMSECLKIQDCQDDVHALFAKLLSEINNPEAELRKNTNPEPGEVFNPKAAFALSVANRLYGEKSYSFLQEFLTQTKTHYDSEMEAVDFINNSEEARMKINNWVEEKTQGKIKDILPKEVVDSTTRMVLVNAIYFKAAWSKQFFNSHTKEDQFRVNKKTTTPVQMMCQEDDFRFTVIDEVNCQILEMPYEGKGLSMIIILPNDIEDNTTGLEKLEKRLTYEKFMEWTRPDKMKHRKVLVKLPQFKMEETYVLNEVLSSMGMVDAFDETKCDFSGMTGNKEVFLSRVSHKAFVEVNETGTEAAASTQMFFVYGSCFNPQTSIPISFTADHPFLFFICHDPTKTIVFAGRFCSP